MRLEFVVNLEERKCAWTTKGHDFWWEVKWELKIQNRDVCFKWGRTEKDEICCGKLVSGTL